MVKRRFAYHNKIWEIYLNENECTFSWLDANTKAVIRSNTSVFKTPEEAKAQFEKSIDKKVNYDGYHEIKEPTADPNWPTGMVDQALEYLKISSLTSKSKEDIKRLDKLSYELIKKYGLDGLRLVNQDRIVFSLSAVPEFFPWQGLEGLTTSQVLENVLRPIKKKIPKTFSMMQERIKIVFGAKKGDDFFLGYVLSTLNSDRDDIYTIYWGGAPIADCKDCLSQKAGNWQLPTELCSFYKVHNGFEGPFYYSLSPASKLITVAKILLIDKHEKLTYSFDDLLEFSPDHFGNSFAFQRTSAEDKKPKAVFWDHETLKLAKISSFWRFIDDTLSDIDE